MRAERYNRNLRDNFTHKLVGVWNKLSEEVVEARTISKHLDRYMDRISLEGYGPTAGRWD